MTHYEALRRLAEYYSAHPELLHADRAAERREPQPSGTRRMRRLARLLRLRVRRRLCDRVRARPRGGSAASPVPGRVTP